MSKRDPSASLQFNDHLKKDLAVMSMKLCLWTATLLILIVTVLVANRTINEFLVFKKHLAGECPFITILEKDMTLLKEGNIREGKKYFRVRIFDLEEKMIAIRGDVYEKNGSVLLHRYRNFDDSVVKEFGMYAKCYEGIRSIAQYFVEEVLVICLVLLMGLAFMIVAIKYKCERPYTFLKRHRDRIWTFDAIKKRHF